MRPAPRSLLLWLFAAGLAAAAGATCSLTTRQPDQPPADSPGPPEPTRTTKPAPPPKAKAPGAPAPAAVPGFQLFETFRPSPQVQEVCDRLGFQPIPLVTARRFYSRREGRVDPEKYQENIWTPDGPADMPPQFGRWERWGIPPNFSGWIDLDFEEPLNQRSVEAYKAAIAQTRRLRPNAKICLHGYILRQEPKGARGKLVNDIVSLCDAISPPIYPVFTAEFANLDQQLRMHEKRIRFCLELGARHNVEVFPVMWKRYRGKPSIVHSTGQHVRRIIPAQIVRQLAEVVVSTELDGRHVDGIIVWGNDPLVLYWPPEKDPLDYMHDDTPDQAAIDASDIRFLEIIAEVVAEQGKPAKQGE